MFSSAQSDFCSAFWDVHHLLVLDIACLLALLTLLCLARCRSSDTLSLLISGFASIFCAWLFLAGVSHASIPPIFKVQHFKADDAMARIRITITIITPSH